MESAFELLHPKVQQVVLDLGWTHLYPIQEEAIGHFTRPGTDLVIAAPTSGGKTEAVFLPILSDLLRNPFPKTTSVRVICISPLKALINDQYARLSRMCQPLGIPVHRWHGDVDMEAKRRLRERPDGILFVTPESVESCFINHPHRIVSMFRGLEYVVIDELHALLETERGMHVRSLLARLVAAIEHRPRCFALSATLADPLAARSFLNVDNPDSVRVISDQSTARPVDVNVVALGANAGELNGGATRIKGKVGTLAMIAEDLRQTFNDGSCLVFANNRRTVEELGDYFLGSELALEGEPAIALHHGSLSARVRRQTESMLKNGAPTRALCTSSLELGIDIGSVEAIAQIDPTWSVLSMVQRLGRSGRKIGATSRLRVYVRSVGLSDDPSLVDLLHPSLLQAVGMVRLLLAGWLEPPRPDRMHLSTLVHQILSILKETGGQTALALYQSLCCQGSFRRVAPEDFKSLLIGLRAHDLIGQDNEGIIILGTAGERITSAPGFYAAFSTPVELTVRCGARPLGRLPATFAIKEGQCLILNAQRWIVDRVDWTAKSIWVRPTTIKRAPVFLGVTGEIHDRVFEEMRRFLLGTDEPAWLNHTGLLLLRSAREAAHRAGLAHSYLIDIDDGVQWFPWVGTRTMRTLQLWAKRQELDCATDRLSLIFNQLSPHELAERLKSLAHHGDDPVALAALMVNKGVERLDKYVAEDLLDKANATDRLDLESAREAARRALAVIRTDR